MSKYTTEVRYICEEAAGLTESQGYNSVKDILEQVANDVMPDYPIFDEAYRKVLNIKILRHYYTREICAESKGLWQLWLENRMNEIMPYYNKLYESELLKFNPLYDVDIHRKRAATGTEETVDTSKDQTITQASKDTASSATNSSSASGKTQTEATENRDTLQRYSDTPQGGLGNLANMDNQYLTNVTDNSSNTGASEKGKTESSTSGSNSFQENVSDSERASADHSGNRSVNTTDDYLEHVYGKQGVYSFSQLLQEYRKTFLNIDKMIIDELKDLFFYLYE